MLISIVKVKNEGNYTSTSSAYPHGMYEDKFVIMWFIRIEVCGGLSLHLHILEFSINSSCKQLECPELALLLSRKSPDTHLNKEDNLNHQLQHCGNRNHRSVLHPLLLVRYMEVTSLILQFMYFY